MACQVQEKTVYKRMDADWLQQCNPSQQSRDRGKGIQFRK